MLSIGLIGCGFMGNIHAEVYKLLSFSKDIKLTAVCDIQKDKADSYARVCSSEFFTDADTLINSKLTDAIDICLPTHMHFEYAKKAIMAGKDVFIEKPVTLTPDETEKLIDLKNKYNTRVMVGQCLRFWPEYLKLKEITDSGKYGPLKNLTLKRLSQKPGWGYENWYMDTEKSGGVTLDLHIHDVDFMRYVLGEPEKIYKAGTPEHIYAIFGYPDGINVSIESGWDFPETYPVETEFRANFKDAVVTYKGNGLNIYEIHGNHYVVESHPLEPNDRISIKAHGYGGYYKELEYFCDCLINNREITINSLEEALKTLRTIYREIENV